MFWRLHRRKERDEGEAFDGVGTLAVIIPALNEEDNIASAVRSALDDGSHGEKGARERGNRRRDRGRGRDRKKKNDAAGFVVVVDGGSSDATVAAARRAGAHQVLRCPTRGRGAQLAAGVAAVGVVGGGGGGGRSRSAVAAAPSSSEGSFFLPPPRRQRKRPDTLLFLHADSRLPRNYRDSISRALLEPSLNSPPSSWGAFETVLPTTTATATATGGEGGLSPATSRFLSACVALRTRLFGLPYGDQGIFVSSDLLEKIGGVRPLPLMEDVDLVARLSLAGREAEKEERKGEKKKPNDSREKKRVVINSRPAVARGAVETSGRRWAEKGLVRATVLNLWTLARWKGGAASAEELAREYYARR